MITNTVKCSGHYKFYKNDEYVGESDNILTDGFFLRVGAQSTDFDILFFMCGSGTSVPAVTDVGLETPIAGAVSLSTVNNNWTNSTGTNGLTSIATYMYAFPMGTFTGTVSEVGARFHTSTSGITSSSDVDSRVLVKDGSGNIAPIVITASDTLTVTFTYSTVWPAQAVGTVNIMGDVHTVTWEILNFGQWRPLIEWGYKSDTNNDQFFMPMHLTYSTSQALYNDPYSSTLLSGSHNDAIFQTGTFLKTYGSNYIEYSLRVRMSSGNLALGVEYVQTHHNNQYTPVATDARWGLHFSPKITHPEALTTFITLRIQYQNL